VTTRLAIAPAARAPRAARSRPRRRGQGFSLIVAMLMLAVIGLFSAAVLRNATSGDQVANNNRLQTQANQYAQLAMRWCESQMALDAAARAAPVYDAATPPAWTVARNWLGAGGASPSHTLTVRDIGSATQPRVAPQCLIEATAVPNVFTVTARGFSADFAADPRTGATRNGAAVWLQATVYADAGAADPAAGGAAVNGAGTAGSNGPLGVRQRLWQQLLTPPF
jgi:type IV pilus assembly protein PilX